MAAAKRSEAAAVPGCLQTQHCGPQPLSNSGGFIWQARVDVTCSGEEEAPTAAVIHRSGKQPGTCLVPPAPTQRGLSRAGGHRAPGTRWHSGSSALPSAALAAAPVSILSSQSISPPSSCHSQQLTPACRSGPAALLGVLQALAVLISLRNSDANMLQAVQCGASSWD